MASTLRLVRAPGPDQRPAPDPAPRGPSWEAWIAVCVVVAAGLLAVAAPDPGSRALRRMAPAERAELFRRARANVASLCNGEVGLRDACRDQVQLLCKFPECDQACQVEALAARPGPTR